MKPFNLPGGGLAQITEELLATVWGFAQHRSKDKEAGGLLIGHQPQGTRNFMVDRLTTPQLGDRRTRCRFHRSEATHQTLLDDFWQASGYTRTYLGEWHTHPEDAPTPSPLDRRSWNEAVSLAAEVHDLGLLFLIVGRLTTRIWHGSPTGPPVVVAELATYRMDSTSPRSVT